VERQFVKEIHLGQTVVPYRLLPPLNAVLPTTPTGILSNEQIEDHPALAAWWERAETAWTATKVLGDDSDLLDRIDFHGQLGAQLPAAQHRVVYTKAGNTLSSARVMGDALIDHKLYWGAVSGLDEARYLTAILNSSTLLERVKPLQALGLFGGRDFDKVVFSLPIATYDHTSDDHRQLADLAAAAETAAAGLTFHPDWTFQRTRKYVRAELDRAGIAQQIEQAVARVVPVPDV